MISIENPRTKDYQKEGQSEEYKNIRTQGIYKAMLSYVWQLPGHNHQDKRKEMKNIENIRTQNYPNEGGETENIKNMKKKRSMQSPVVLCMGGTKAKLSGWEERIEDYEIVRAQALGKQEE